MSRAVRWDRYWNVILGCGAGIWRLPATAAVVPFRFGVPVNDSVVGDEGEPTKYGRYVRTTCEKSVNGIRRRLRMYPSDTVPRRALVDDGDDEDVLPLLLLDVPNPNDAE